MEAYCIECTSIICTSTYNTYLHQSHPRPSLILSPYSLQVDQHVNDGQLPFQSFEVHSSFFLFSMLDAFHLCLVGLAHRRHKHLVCQCASPNALCPHSVPNVVLIGCRMSGRREVWDRRDLSTTPRIINSNM